VEHASEAVDAYRRYGPALVRKAERILQNRDDAGDVVQGLFTDLMRSRRVRWELPYLYRAVTNRCLNLVRDRDNRARLLERQEPALRGPARIRCDELVIGLEQLARLADRLDERSLEVLVCRYVDDMTQEEIAGALGISRRTVGKRLDKIRDAVGALAAASEGAR